MTRKLAERVVAWRWYIIAGWIVLGALLVVLAPSLNNFTSSGYGLPASYQSTQAGDDRPEEGLPVGGLGLRHPSRSTPGTTQHYTAADLQKIDGLTKALDSEHIDSVDSVTTSPLLLSKNQKIQLIEVAMTGQPGDDGPNAAVTTLRSDTNAYLTGSGLRGQLTGNAAISVDQGSEFDRAQKIIWIATVLLILILLTLVFRSVIIAFLPLLVVGLVHQMAQSLTAFFAQWFGFSVGTELAPLLIVVMFGVGTDYIVFMLFRYREQLGKGQEPHESLMVALCRAGEVICVRGRDRHARLRRAAGGIHRPAAFPGPGPDHRRGAHAASGPDAGTCHPQPVRRNRLLADNAKKPRCPPPGALGADGGQSWPSAPALCCCPASPCS